VMGGHAATRCLSGTQAENIEDARFAGQVLRGCTPVAALD
jgi:hypothetical protein